MVKKNKPDLSGVKPVLIAGAGPTGLLLGVMLAMREIPFRIFEPRESVSQHSRSIGIHPPSLQLFKETGLLDEFLEKGNRIHSGKAFVNHDAVGTISFSKLEHPYPFILTLSQQITEQILENRLLELAPDSLIRGQGVADFTRTKKGITAILDNSTEVEGSYLVGADGKNSLVREKAGIEFLGGTYPDHYVMGDFEENIDSRDEARVFLTSRGLVESFPHGQNLRRWVIKTSDKIDTPEAGWIAKEAMDRTGTSPDPESCSMLSSFGVQRLTADAFFKKRVILAGDAAHVVSPIGGQGMNLGWFDAALLAGLLPDILNPEKPRPKLLHSYEYRRKRAAYAAAQRAEFNLKTGRAFPHKTAFLKKLIVHLMLLPPARGILLKKFTMEGLD